MFGDLQSALRLDQASMKRLFVHVVEEEDQLGSFILHHFINLGVKRQAKVILIGFENTFGHYNGVGLKLGVSLLKLKESGAVEYIDGLKLISTSFNEDGQLNHNIYIQKVLTELENNATDGAFVVVDKISLLQTLGLPAREMFRFSSAIQKTALRHNCCLVTCSRASSKLGILHEDLSLAESDHLSAFLAHSANLNIVARPLPSGKSLNVTGNLTFMWANADVIHQMQFRVEEKDVRVFAKGTSNAVL